MWLASIGSPGRGRARVIQSGSRRLRVLALLAAAGLVAAGCGSSQHSTGGAAAASFNAKIGSLYYTDSLDPALGESGGDYAYLNMIYDRLMTINSTTGALEPGLATSFKFQGANNLQYAMTIRTGVKFQDGSALDAAAVKASLQHFIAVQEVQVIPPSSIASIDVTGKYSLVINLTKQFASLPLLLADRAGMIVSPTALQKYGKSFAQHPVGAGPFSFVSQVPQSSVTFKKFPGYWDAAQIKLSGATISYYPTDVSLYNAVQSGAVQVAEDLPGSDLKPAKSNPNLTVASAPQTGFDNIFFNLGKKPLNNVDVRMAFNLALNRPAIARLTTSGLGAVGTQPYAPSFPYYDPAVANSYAYNPARARQLLAQAGFAKGVSFTCLYYPGAEYETAAPLIISDEAAVGIHLNVVSESLSEAANAFNVAGTVPCLFADWGSGYNAAETMSQLFASNSYYNGGLQNKGKVNYGADNEIAALNSAVTLTQLKAGIGQVLTKVASNALWAPLFFKPAFIVLTHSVHADGDINGDLGGNYRVLAPAGS
jgi:peptide/nickel transport system substrate-binding protein